MVVIRGRFVTYGALWFEDDIPASPRVDVLLLSDRKSVVRTRHWKPFLTLVNDLTQSEAQLYGTLGSTLRYEIRRAEARDGLAYELLNAPRERLDQFIEFYDRFAAINGLPPVYRSELVAACDAGRLHLSAASAGGETIVWHAYIISGERAILLHSASLFRRIEEAAERARIARANKWAHWQDMVAFKRAGFRSFDWGGMFSDESVPAQAGINRFKRQFGGRPERNYDCRMALTARGRLALALLPLIDALAAFRSRRRKRGEAPSIGSAA